MMRCVGLLNWLLVVLAGAALVLVVVDFVLVGDNRALQAEVNQRQQSINQNAQVGRVRDALVRDIAAAAVSGNDDKLREVLTRQGITINVSPGNASSGARPAPGAGSLDAPGTAAGERP